MSENKSTNLAELQGGSLELTRKQAPMSLTTGLGFEQLVRVAKVLNQSSMVPAQYRAFVEKKQGRDTVIVENPSGLANCIIALNMAVRMNADPLQIMQSLYVIEGRPSWSSQFIIAMINSSGRYSPLRFDLSEEGPERDVEYTVTEWVNGQRQRAKRTAKVKARTCRAWAYELSTNDRLDGPEVSMDIAVAEGWFSKDGSKWQTMPEVMLRYRAASLFGRLYAPELLMGLQSQEEAEDIAVHQAREVSGTRLQQVDLDDLREPQAPAIFEQDEEAPVETVDTSTGEIQQAPKRERKPRQQKGGEVVDTVPLQNDTPAQADPVQEAQPDSAALDGLNWD